ncbi:MAG: 4-hydroxy-tetrahydrodipicolinate reductase [Planctomycetes bacterium]|nr:4-hydroxy-tetrahydrodipicolinate reductase [Planctomycetota bacterium]
MKTVIAVNGACGRMGLRIVEMAHHDKALAIGAALEGAEHPDLGKDVGVLAGVGELDVAVTADIPIEKRIDVVIDFSVPEGTMAVLPTCVGRRIPLIVATTGHNSVQKEEIEGAAHHTAILVAPSMSLVVNLLFKLVREAATVLRDKDFDVEIVERHHRFKKDSPSGTALHFARIIQDAMGHSHVRHGREGLVGERPIHEIGMHAIRAGDNVGEHTIIFSAIGETMELVHKGYSRDAYVRGAILAAKFLANRPAGRYTMKDVLGL